MVVDQKQDSTNNVRVNVDCENLSDGLFFGCSTPEVTLDDSQRLISVFLVLGVVMSTSVGCQDGLSGLILDPCVIAGSEG